MWNKADYYSAVAKETLGELTASWQEWVKFLTTASRLYKYPFMDQMMIYAQRPDATACAEYGLWSDKMNRYVRRGSKGIALLNEQGDRLHLRYVFDVSDTGMKENARTPWLWTMQEQHKPSISAMLEQNYDAHEGALGDQIASAARALAEGYWEDNQRDFLYIVDDSFLAEYDEYNIGSQFKAAVTASVTYSVLSRCGLQPEQYMTHEDFFPIFDFNTIPAVMALGSAVSQCSRQILQQIGDVIRAAERESIIEGRMQNEEYLNLHQERGLPDSQSATGRAAPEVSGQVRTDAPGLSEGAAPADLQPSAAEWDTVSPSAGDRGDSEPAPGTNDVPVIRESPGTGQKTGRDGMGTAHEHTESPGRGSHSDGAYQQLSFIFPAENVIENQAIKGPSKPAPGPFSMPQKQNNDLTEETPVSPALPDFSVHPVSRDGDTLIIGSGEISHELDITVSDEEYAAIRQVIPEQSLPHPAAANFRITDDHLGEGGPKQKFRANIMAIQRLKKCEEENRPATPEEQKILSNYVGWGGLSDAFDERKENWSTEYLELKTVLTPEEYTAARASTLNAHYTSPTVIRAIYDAVEQMGFQKGNILEPSMGVGNFFGLLPESMQGSRLYGVELDSISGRIAKKLYPNAEITIAGFETTDRRDFYDLAVGNVPFGDYKVNDKPYNKLGFSIHNYFFAKALDQVRPGGVVAFVISRYTMDAKSPEVRRYLAQRAELLGAIRLPNNAFRANAGTDVVSDILFLQKREHPVDLDADWIHLARTEGGLTLNSYFVEHPEMVLGQLSIESTQYGKEECTVLPIEGADLSEQLKEAISHIHGHYQAMKQETSEIDGEDSPALLPADPAVKNFSYTVVDGEIYFRENSIMSPVETSETAKSRIKGMVELRQIVNDLIEYQLEDYPQKDIEAKQQELSAAYDVFTAKHGLINSRSNEQAFSEDSSYYLLCSLENIDENGNLESKTDIFTKRTIRPEHHVTHVDTPSEALAVSIGERGKVDVPFMAELLGRPEEYEEVTSALRGVIFHDPLDSDSPEHGWQTADEYLSGNVRDKLRIAQLAAQTDPQYAVNVTALEKAQPKDLEASEIEVRLGATWIDPEYIQQFMQETFETPFYLRRAIEVKFSPITAEWQISGKSSPNRHDVAAYMTYGTDRANAYKILEDTLNLKDIRIYDVVEDVEGNKKRVLNKRETTLAQQKQQAIKDAFRDWIWRDPIRRQTLVTRYNELFNSTRPREYDGSHIHFVGMNRDINANFAKKLH